jgi:hypothetical protein
MDSDGMEKGAKMKMRSTSTTMMSLAKKAKMFSSRGGCWLALAGWASGWVWGVVCVTQVPWLGKAAPSSLVRGAKAPKTAQFGRVLAASPCPQT